MDGVGRSALSPRYRGDLPGKVDVTLAHPVVVGGDGNETHGHTACSDVDIGTVASVVDRLGNRHDELGARRERLGPKNAQAPSESTRQSSTPSASRKSRIAIGVVVSVIRLLLFLGVVTGVIFLAVARGYRMGSAGIDYGSQVASARLRIQAFTERSHSRVRSKSMERQPSLWAWTCEAKPGRTPGGREVRSLPE